MWSLRPKIQDAACTGIKNYEKILACLKKSSKIQESTNRRQDRPRMTNKRQTKKHRATQKKKTWAKMVTDSCTCACLRLCLCVSVPLAPRARDKGPGTRAPVPRPGTPSGPKVRAPDPGPSAGPRHRQPLGKNYVVCQTLISTPTIWFYQRKKKKSIYHAKVNNSADTQQINFPGPTPRKNSTEMIFFNF